MGIPINEYNIVTISNIADFLKMPDLIKRCSTFMVYNITVDNALEFLKFAAKFKVEKIKLKAVEVLADRFANKLEYVVDLDLNHLKDLLRYCKDSKEVTDRDMLNAIIKWSKKS